MNIHRIFTLALKKADLAIIATEWEEIKQIPLETYELYMKNPVVIDGRNCYSLQDIQKYPMTYISIGRPTIMINIRKVRPINGGE